MGIARGEIPIDVSDAVWAAVRNGEKQAREEFAAIVGVCVAGSLGLVMWVLAILAAFAILA